MRDRKIIIISVFGIVFFVVLIGLLLWWKGYLSGSSSSITYRGRSVSESVIDTARSKYKNVDKKEVDKYVKKIAEDYLVYESLLESNNIPLPTRPQTISDIEKNLPIIRKVVEDNLVSTADFAYIKVKFDRMAGKDEALKKLGDLKAWASASIQKYSKKLSKPNLSESDIQAVLDESNRDVVMDLLNFNENNEIVRNYKKGEGIFFTDKGFDDFLFKQKVGVLSPVYEIKDNGSPYAYLIVYPLRIENRKLNSLER